VKKESLAPEERQALLDEVRSYLPAFLERGATLQEDPAGDVRELLDLDQRDLDRVVAVHTCLDPAVVAFGEALAEGLDHPMAGSSATATVSQSVRGRIDWQQTLRHRARAPGERASYAVREPGKTFDTPENRAIVWLLDSLERAVDEATAWRVKKPPIELEERRWWQRIDALRRQLAAARRVAWLQGVRAEKPTPATLRGLRSGRNVFYREKTVAAMEVVRRLAEPSPETLTALLAERYFRPRDDGTLFEVAVALRLARAFAELSPHRRQPRLMMGDGKSSFASYAFDDGSEVSLACQAWPDDEKSMRRRFVKRHGLAKQEADARPDIIIVRRGSVNDAVILELKASQDASYLRKGLEELLAYLADRPDLWGEQPAGWLIAPLSSAFEGAEADTGFPLWVLSAEEVASAATARFVG
jgi:hypothetical protein